MGARTRGFANNVLTAGKIDTSDGLSGVVPNSNVNNTSVSGVTSLPPSVGSGIASVSSNPAAPVASGIIWYNTTDERFKVAAVSKAWSSSSNLSTAKNAMGAFGIQTAAVSTAGKTPPTTNATEEYNGTGWTTGGNYPISTSESGAAGTLTAGLMFGGQNPPETNVTGEYDGTSWTAGGNLTTTRTSLSGAGTQTAGLASGGTAQPSSSYANVEEYNGTSWSEVNDIPTARGRMGSAGKTQTAALVAGGGPPATTNSFEYDGTNWTAGGNINVARYGLKGNGTLTSALVYGGDVGSGTYVTTSTEEYDGTSWTTTTALGTAKVDVGSAGADNTSAVAYGGATFPNTSATEEYNASIIVTTAGAWASGANYPVTIQDASGVGPVTANATFGGYDGPSYTNATNEYDGSSWTSGGNMNTARATYQTGIGSQTAAIGVSGYIPGGGPTGSTNTESYNGTSWTNVNSLSTSRYNASATGVQTSGIITGGNTPSATNATEEWDGTNWTAGGNTPVVSAGKGMFGQSSSDALLCGANNPPAGTYITLSYDGTSWSDTGHNLLDRKDTLAGGSQQAATNLGIIAGGFDSAPSIVASSYQYNGSSWVTGPSISTSRRGGAAAGTYASCMAVGGEQPTQSNHTEEFTSETTAVNVENITDS